MIRCKKFQNWKFWIRIRKIMVKWWKITSLRGLETRTFSILDGQLSVLPSAYPFRPGRGATSFETPCILHHLGLYNGTTIWRHRTNDVISGHRVISDPNSIAIINLDEISDPTIYNMTMFGNCNFGLYNGTTIWRHRTNDVISEHRVISDPKFYSDY